MDQNKPSPLSFPPIDSVDRIRQYEYYQRLLDGDHYTAFNIKIDSEDYTKAYKMLRYVKVNFAGLISRIVADLLTGETVTIKDDENQEFVDALWHENNMDVQLFEAALSGSALGDIVFKLRVGKRNASDTESTVIIEMSTPIIYFPEINQQNVKADPEVKELAWTYTKDATTYLQKEIHTSGKIENKLYELFNGKISATIDTSVIGLEPEVETGIPESLVLHIPNYRTGNTLFGISDYADMDSLFFAINHRMSQIDNILDKHGDPILMVPPGILDKKGNVNKKAIGVIEVQDGETARPEYIVWDASLENAFKYIEKLVEFVYMTGEISPDSLGMGQGSNDSGRALKLKLIRTLAKVARKKLYFDVQLKNLIYRAEKLAKAHNLTVGGIKFTGEPTKPEIQWADGLPIDISEQIETEAKAIDASLTSTRDAIMRVYGSTQETADKSVQEIKDESSIPMPQMKIAPQSPIVDNVQK